MHACVHACKRWGHHAGCSSHALAAGPAKMRVLLIPGNPGNCNYYEMHLRELHRALEGQAEVLSISHAGHELQANKAVGKPGRRARTGVRFAFLPSCSTTTLPLLSFSSSA
jgi:hypothetical protein